MVTHIESLTFLDVQTTVPLGTCLMLETDTWNTGWGAVLAAACWRCPSVEGTDAFSMSSHDLALMANYWRLKPANDDLSEEDLRAVALTLFTLVKFLCPSNTTQLNRFYMHCHNSNAK